MTRIVKASEFKAKCLKLIDEVAVTGEDIVITKRGKAVARVSRESTPTPTRSIYGILKGQIELVDPDVEISAFGKDSLRAWNAKIDRIADDLARPRRRRRARRQRR